MKLFIATLLFVLIGVSGKAQGYINATDEQIRDDFKGENITEIIKDNNTMLKIKTSDAIYVFNMDKITKTCQLSIISPNTEQMLNEMINYADENYKLIYKRQKWTNIKDGIKVVIELHYDNSDNRYMFIYKLAVL
jgi:hypothetical protein